ncbi:MAG: ribosomal L7Ae/L30e/S12e/Gadd45 family protein [Xylanivirga thermophila]|jgi:large subunit ribosomal protein L7A|uniref:ribosomal L7Ae/L30e/S12e/Gadd45 family protein n=1 Tax=Xylanivirga thermophila TaxID=2496273 RepID=UPI00101D1C02|nr:ribosomal L7Ae/L30e/S12e/Gadd45 family protein [Xylanivirga thermophila]
MLEELKCTSARTVGTKQTLKAIEKKQAKEVFIAKDIDEYIARKIVEACEMSHLPITFVDSMKELGEACGIDVGAATAALLR